MVGTSKILTVSYGTFSCTLEGFDDSFNTMKAIAEYFRDLASDDRYFGAEPPTPDAEMLARIAEKEISRRVEARMDDSGVVLRPALANAATMSPEAEAPAEGDTSSNAIAAVVASTAAAAASDSAAEDMAPVDSPVDSPVESNEAEDTVSEAPVASEEAAHTEETRESDPVTDVTGEDGDHGSAVEEGRDASSSVLAAADPSPVSEPEPEAVPEAIAAPAQEEAEAPVAEAPAEAEAPAAPVAETIVPAHPDADSVAAKLQRIRAVVGNNTPAKDDETADYSEDLTESFFDNADTPDVADVADPVADPVAEADPVNEVQETAPAGGPDMIARVMARQTPATADVDEPDATADTGTETGEDTATADEAAAEDQNAPRVVRVKRADLAKLLEESATSETAVEDEGVDDFSDLNLPTDHSGPDLGLLDGADELDEYLDDSEGSTNLSDEDEADLMEELAEVEAEFDDAAELSDEPAEETAEATALEDAVSDDTDTPQRDRAGRAILEAAPENDQEGLNRLLSEADEQMDEPEGNRRRAAIAQLKAAVAATGAARAAGEDIDDDEEVENAFREDLSQVVQPRRAPRAENHTERPRPAPLKLVASQRVDRPAGEVEADKPVTPVRPRRVQSRPEGAAAPKDSASFADFAASMGASELPELLEAAAAYTSFVEGAEEFSRPQIIRRVHAATEGEFNREDGLRSFADLLREGRITKVRAGRFQVAKDTRFNPERQAS